MAYQVVSAEENFLAYIIDSSTPLILEFRLLYCSPEVTEFLNKERWFCDHITKTIVAPHVTIDMTVPNKLTMEKFQWIQGFVSGNSYLPYIMRFESEEMKQMYVNRLISTLIHLVASLTRSYRAELLSERKIKVRCF